MRKRAPVYPEGLKQCGIRLTLPSLERVEREMQKRRKRTGNRYTLSDIVRELLEERLDQLDPPHAKTG